MMIFLAFYTYAHSSELITIICFSLSFMINCFPSSSDLLIILIKKEEWSSCGIDAEMGYIHMLIKVADIWTGMKHLFFHDFSMLIIWWWGASWEMNFAQIGGNHSQYPTQKVDSPPSYDNQVICIRLPTSFLGWYDWVAKGVSPQVDNWVSIIFLWLWKYVTKGGKIM